jgi:hypothetical protein
MGKQLLMFPKSKGTQPLQSLHRNKRSSLDTISCTHKKHDKTTQYLFKLIIKLDINPIMAKLNPSAQRCMTIFFTGDIAS